MRFRRFNKTSVSQVVSKDSSMSNSQDVKDHGNLKICMLCGHLHHSKANTDCEILKMYVF